MMAYRPWLERAGFQVDVSPFFDDRSLQRLYDTGRGCWSDILRAYARRQRVMFSLRHYRLIWLEKELFPFMPGSVDAMLRQFGVPYVVDYDDATFHRYDAHPSRMVRASLGTRLVPLMRGARMITAGNTYLADYARQAGAADVRELPTVVELSHYSVGSELTSGPFRIGWIGSPSTAKYLEMVRRPLQVLARERAVRLVVIGARDIPDIDVPLERHSWSADTESALLGTLHVGIMPLADGLWERGKCGYKLLQYMACGKPVIASPVGVNAEITTPEVGRLACSDDEWLAALRSLSADPGLRRQLGLAGRARVEADFSLQVVAPRLVAMMRHASGVGA